MVECFGNDYECGEHAEAFCWSKEKSDFAQIGVQIATPGMIQNHIQVSGRVVKHPDHVAYIMARVHGIVTEVYKNLGDNVEKDEVIAVIESNEIAQMKSAYLTAFKKWEFQHTLLKKEEALKGISSGQDYLNAQFALDEAAFLKELALQNLYSLGIDNKEIETIRQGDQTTLRLYKIKSPIKGKILQRDLTLGELIDDEARIFMVGNFDKIWIEINVPQNDVQYLAPGLSLEMTGINGKKENLHLAQFNPTISEETRTATAIAILANEEGKWSPGEFVMVSIQTEHIQAPLVVPQEAILHIKGAEYIFVQEEDTFTPTIVKVGKRDGKNVEILSGLKVGESYASCNTFCLKAEFEKEEAEHGH